MTVRDIIIERLKADGFDGLYFRLECACEIADLVPCSEDCSGCKPGYKVMCASDCHHEFPFEDGQWHIQAEKPEVT